MGTPELNNQMIGRNLKDIRRRAGFLPAEVASHLGISTSTLGRYETGTAPIRFIDAVRLANLYGCSLEVLARYPSASNNKISLTG